MHIADSKLYCSLFTVAVLNYWWLDLEQLLFIGYLIGLVI